MPAAPFPADELDRLQALLDYEVLDTEAEQSFDDLTNLASHLCDTSIALVSLIDTTRQWFKAKAGLEACETGRDIAFCAHAILQRDIFEIPDAKADPRFAENPLVTGPPFIRYYAGAPLVTPQGYAIGTLCVIDTRPKSLLRSQKEGLQILARAVVSQLELRKSLDRQAKLSQFKMDFFSNMSHELRTPLNAILALSQLMQEQIVGASPNLDQLFQNLKTIEFSGERLLNQINNVLDISKLEAGKMRLVERDFDFRTTFTHVYDMLAPQAKAKQLDYRLHIDHALPPFLYMDEDKAIQILTNLLSNAVKFTLPGKQVSTYIQKKDDWLEIMVRDQGIGIAPDYQKRLFHRFEQVAEQKGGTGLGLAICKSLAELMGGEIFVTSEQGKGSLFKVRLPFNEGKCPLIDQNPLLTLKTDLDILLVEDNAINQDVARAVLENEGLTVKIAPDGEQAIALAAKQPWSMVLMDRHLPDMDGIEVSRKIKALCPDLPIVMWSADQHVQHHPSTKDAGIADYLNKPLDKNALIRALNKYGK
ncbi:ATP-binding protein [Aliiglaciecola sp. CAU 1673]|uniref:ATP-binding response regulator n=1 Tax=Aliiglaciecola sp. CAU 1673 TaxID=3032595 RepID=UPI0023DCC86A|nr:GAF domain-containing hybrid sensor histidine kinase/response regulator [Aliiglaciecola sp. CAU 1673]MDF2179460.1 ATP-binding protein [Aliiglaciecola sp. CAU 1673]